MSPDAVHKNREQQKQQARLQLAEPCADVFWIDVWFVRHLSYLVLISLYPSGPVNAITQLLIERAQSLLSWSVWRVSPRQTRPHCRRLFQ